MQNRKSPVYFLSVPAGVALACLLAHPTSALAQAQAMTVQLAGNGFAAASQINAGVKGAGVNGPGAAQVGLKINMNKTDWWDTKAAVGEVDGQYVSIFQGGPGSDTSAYLGEITAGGLGFASIIEGTVSIQPPITSGNGVRTAQIDVQVGAINQGTQMYGYTANLGQKPHGGSAIGYNLNGSGWDYLAQWFNGSTDEFHVDGSGNVQAAGAVRAGLVTTAALPKACAPGMQLYASDGRKAGEAAGLGSGVPVICTQTSHNGATAWYTLWGGAPVAG